MIVRKDTPLVRDLTRRAAELRPLNVVTGEDAERMEQNYSKLFARFAGVVRRQSEPTREEAIAAGAYKVR
jgi:hypothetical protein